MKGCIADGVFEFPTLNTSTITVTENDTIRLRFKISNVNCIRSGKNTISVKTADRKKWPCEITIDNGTCHNSGCCQCDENAHYTLAMNVTRHDSHVWLWQLLTWDPISQQNKKITEKEITLDVSGKNTWDTTIQQNKKISEKQLTPYVPGKNSWDTTSQQNKKTTEKELTLDVSEDEFRGVTSTSSRAETDGKEKREVDDVNDPQSVIKFIAIVVAVVVVVGIISVSVSVTLICLKKGSGSNGRQALQHEELDAIWPALPDPENGSGSSLESQQSSNTYQEIPDEPELVPLAVVRPTRHCLAPRDDPGYIHATPSLPDISEIRAQGLAQPRRQRQISHLSRLEDSPRQQPIYENCTNSL